MLFPKVGEYNKKQVLAAVRIHRAKIVDCPRYLFGLWDMLHDSTDADLTGIGIDIGSHKRRMKWVKEAITSSSSVEKLSAEFDAVILACGAALPKLLSPHPLGVKLVRGQNVYITPQKLPAGYPALLRDALIFGEYIVPKSSHTGSENSRRHHQLLTVRRTLNAIHEQVSSRCVVGPRTST